MIRDKYRIEGEVRARYIRKHICQDWYEWCEQSATDPRYDIAQGTADAEDVPEHIRKTCDANRTAHYACEWPI